MTNKEFEQALMRGQGRALSAVRKSPQKYLRYVMRLCDGNVSFDPQCEGTRSAYTYDIICAYGDKTPFLRKIIYSLKKVKNHDQYNVLYFSELLCDFGRDGYDEAINALWEKYEELLLEISENKGKTRKFRAATALEKLCLSLCGYKKAYAAICSDIGALYLRESFYEVYDFDWLFGIVYDARSKTIDKLSKHNLNIAEFLRIGKAKKAEQRRSFENFRNGKENVSDLQSAQRYLEQTSVEGKIRALDVFSYRAFPSDPSPIIDDAGSDDEKLKSAALLALENVRHPAVKNFASKRIDGENTAEYLKIFIANYEKSDKDKLVSAIESVPVDRNDKSGWHSLFLTVLVKIPDCGEKIPNELLKYMYETTYCSSCREYVLRQMSQQRVLTEEILNECLYDCNYDLRAWAYKKLQRKKNRERIKFESRKEL